jgi:hypothetical protein
VTEQELRDHELWAWVTETHDGRVVLVGVGLSLAEQLPLISHSRESILRLQPLALAHGKALNQPVWLRRYTVSEEIGRITATLNTKRSSH